MESPLLQLKCLVVVVVVERLWCHQHHHMVVVVEQLPKRCGPKHHHQPARLVPTVSLLEVLALLLWCVLAQLRLRPGGWRPRHAEWVTTAAGAAFVKRILYKHCCCSGCNCYI